MSREYKKMKEDELENVAEDLIARFLLFLPESEKKPPRVFQPLIEAHWFYADFLAKNSGRDEKINEDTKFSILPQKKEREFFRFMFERTPFLKKLLPSFSSLYDGFKNYQSRIPRYGAIILNKDFTKVLLVVSYNGGFYDFPKGKVDENEEEDDWAVREVYEEIGFDISPLINQDEYITKCNNSVLLHTEHSKSTNEESTQKLEKFVKLYIVHGVSEEEEFQILTRKEISKIEWISIDFLRRSLIESTFNEKYSNVRPFIFLLAKYIAYKQGRVDGSAMSNIKALNFTDDETKVYSHGKSAFFKKAKNCHLVELDFDEAYKYYHKAIESYDSAINALENLFTLVLSFRGGVQEWYELLEEFKFLFYNINDYKKHLKKLKEIENCQDTDDSYKIVIELVHNDYNVEYPMIKENPFREKVEYSYMIQQVNQIFIGKGEQDESKFISNETMKKESHKSNSKPLNGKPHLS